MRMIDVFENMYRNGFDEGYKQGKADVLKNIAKIVNDYVCDRDIKSNVSLEKMINEYIYKKQQ